MLQELFVSSVMVVATVAMHAAALGLFGGVVDRLLAARPKGPPRIRVVLLIVLGLFSLHGAEIWAYAGAFVALGAVADLRTGVYVSTQAYATLGFPAEIVAARWRLVPAIEGINGILLLGWTTAFFVTTMERVRRPRRPPATTSRAP